MTVKTVIVLVPDQYNEKGGCKHCLFMRPLDPGNCFNGCGANALPAEDYLRCARERGYWAREVKASVSRNKREGKFLPALRHFYYTGLLTRTGRAHRDQ